MSGASNGNGIDETSAFLGSSCSYSDYLGEKFYEYVAMLEMIYLLATDANFRKQVIDEIASSAASDVARGVLAANVGSAHQQNAMFERLLSFFGLGSEEHAAASERAAMENFQRSSEHSQLAMQKIEQYFLGLWQQIKRRYYDCGWFYAVSTTATDAAFFLGELAIGAGIAGVSLKVLRGLKFTVSRLPNGRIRADVINETSGARVRREFSEEDLSAKYGEPRDNHNGVLHSDPNRQIPDEPADGMANRISSGAKGLAAERAARQRLDAEGFRQVRMLKNNSEHGIDLIGRNPTTGEMKIIEVKANTAGLNDLQNLGGPEYTNRQLNNALNPTGAWKSMPAGMDATAREIRNWLRASPSTKYEIWKYNVDDAGNTVYRGKADWNWQPDSRPRRLVYRDDAGTRSARPTSNAPSTGPP